MQKILIFTFLILHQIAFSQGENNIWYFGGRGGLNFNYSPALYDTSGQINGFTETSATVSDSKGNLIFYTNGINVWNKSHNVMNNGSNLESHSSTTQGVLITSYPEKDSSYLIFTLGSSYWDHDKLQYSVVNLKQEFGLGTVTHKNIFLDDSFTEKMTAALGLCNNMWLVAHKIDNNVFHSYRISNNGVNHIPVISEVGGNQNQYRGSVAFNNNYNQLAIVNDSNVEIFTFDKANGKISNPQTIVLNQDNPEKDSRTHSLCFSPNGELLYIGQEVGIGVELIQLNLTSGDPQTISQTKKVVFNYNSTPGAGEIELGPDNKIYLNGIDPRYIDIIHNPNEIYPFCNFQNKAIPYIFVEEGNFQSALQNLVLVPDFNPVLSSSFSKDTIICNTNLRLSATTPTTTYLWQDGSTDSTYTVTASGIYWVERNVDDCVIRRDSITVQIEEPMTTSEMTICASDSVYIGGKLVTESGFYEDTIPSTSGGCDTVLLVDVIVEPLPESDTINVTLSSGEVFHFKGNSYIFSGFYTLRIPSEEQCDSLFYLAIKEAAQLAQKDHLYIPNIFSPNGDHQNDELIISTNKAILDYSLAVYDRYGQKIWTTTEISHSWDGTTSSQMVRSGVYIVQATYKIEGSPLNNVQIEAVTVVR